MIPNTTDGQHKSLPDAILDASLRSQQSLAIGKAASKVKKLPWISIEDALPQNDSNKPPKSRKYYLVKLAPSGLMCVATFGYRGYDCWIDTFGRLLVESYGTSVTHWCPLPQFESFRHTTPMS